MQLFWMCNIGSDSLLVFVAQVQSALHQKLRQQMLQNRETKSTMDASNMDSHDVCWELPDVTKPFEPARKTKFNWCNRRVEGMSVKHNLHTHTGI